METLSGKSWSFVATREKRNWGRFSLKFFDWRKRRQLLWVQEVVGSIAENLEDRFDEGKDVTDYFVSRTCKRPELFGKSAVGLCFSEKRELAQMYAVGQNDQDNRDVGNGVVTKVEFDGAIIDRKDIRVALDFLTTLRRKGIYATQVGMEAIRCADGTVIVFDTKNLKNPTQE